MKAFLLDDRTIGLKNTFEYKEIIKNIQGRKWDSQNKIWKIPFSEEAINFLKNIPECQIDYKIIELYKQRKQAIRTIEEIKTADVVEPIEPIPLKDVQLFQHQIKAYNAALLYPSFAILFEMGLGKSLTAVAIACRRYLRGEINRLLVVAQTSILDVWANEFEKAAVQYDLKILNDSIEKRKQQLKTFKQNVLQVAVINYEATWRMIDELIAWKPDMVILDESQRIKNPSAQQSKACHKLGDVAKYKLILSGTPIQNSPLDVFSQWKFLDKTIFGTSYYSFRARYAVMGGYGGYQVVDYKNLNELIKKAHSIAIRVTKDEALDLPEQVDEIRYCILEPNAQRIYQDIKEQSIAELEAGEITVRNVLTKLLRLSQITGGFVNTDDGIRQKVSEAKLAVLDELIDDIVVDNNKKVVIFARFIPEIEAILKLLESKKIQYAWITGEVDIKKRGDEVKRFQEDKNYKVFVAQIQTAGLGITLHAADIAIFYSLDFSYANYQQAKARIHRIGQQNKCTYIHLIAKNTVDVKIIKALQKKEEIAKKIMDNWRWYFE